MIKQAQKLGYLPRLLSSTLSGEARAVGAMLATLPKQGEAIIAAGETTVTVTGQGRGGRNQEVALGALSKLPPDTLVLSCGTDGVDNSPAAGALADYQVKKTAQQQQISITKHLLHNNSYSFFQKTGAHIVTGPTGVNAADVMIALRH